MALLNILITKFGRFHYKKWQQGIEKKIPTLSTLVLDKTIAAVAKLAIAWKKWRVSSHEDCSRRLILADMIEPGEI